MYIYISKSTYAFGNSWVLNWMECELNFFWPNFSSPYPHLEQWLYIISLLTHFWEIHDSFSPKKRCFCGETVCACIINPIRWWIRASQHRPWNCYATKITIVRETLLSSKVHSHWVVFGFSPIKSSWLIM